MGIATLLQDFSTVSWRNVRIVFQLLNDMVREGEVVNYAIGGAIAAVFYVGTIRDSGHRCFVMMKTDAMRGEAIVVEDWPVQFIPVSNALEEEAFLNAATLDFEAVPVRVVLAEHLVAIMLRTARLKDLARVEMFLSQSAVDQTLLLDIVRRHKLEKQWAEFQNRGLQ